MANDPGSHEQVAVKVAAGTALSCCHGTEDPSLLTRVMQFSLRESEIHVEELAAEGVCSFLLLEHDTSLHQLPGDVQDQLQVLPSRI